MDTVIHSLSKPAVLLTCFAALSAESGYAHVVLSEAQEARPNISAVRQVIAKIAERKDVQPLSTLAFDVTSSRLAMVAPLGEDLLVWEWRSASSSTKRLGIVPGTGLFTSQDGLAYSLDGKLLALAHSAKKEDGWGVLRVWDQSGHRIHEITEPVRYGIKGTLAFSPDSRTLIRGFSANQGDQIEAYDTKTWAKDWGIRTFPFIPESLSLSPDGKWIAVGGGPKDTGASTSAIAILDVVRHNVDRWIPAFSYEQKVQVIAWSADSTRVVAGTTNSSDGNQAILMIFDAHSGQKLSEERATAERINTVQFTPDGKYLIVAREKKSIAIWDAQHKEMMQEIPVLYGRTAVSHDSKYIGVISLGQVSIWQFE